MEAGAQKLLESVTHGTLHAHSFSRSSSQATHVLTDLLSRYLTLLSSTCAKYAQHAGRSALSLQDALSALEDMGMDINELRDFCTTEANDLARYAVHTARRMEDLREIKVALADGLRQDRDDAIALVYAPVALDQEMMEDEDEIEDDTWDGKEDHIAVETAQDAAAHELQWDQEPPPIPRNDPPSLRPPLSPPLPLSPISNPSSPARKRARTSSWCPPAYIPDFLPPFPREPEAKPPSPPASPMRISSHPPELSEQPTIKVERQPSPPPQSQLQTSSQPQQQPQQPSAGASDYTTRVPYALSSLSSTPTWLLPSPPSPPPSTSNSTLYHPNRTIPHPHPALLGAYHHMLTHPPSSEMPPSNANPARHKIAMALLAQGALHPRWDAPDTLYGSTAPNEPRMTSVVPTYPKALPRKDAKEKKGDEKELFPPPQSRSILASERIFPLISSQASRIPELARQLLSNSVYTRTTRILPPQPLVRGTDKPEKLTYGEGILAPWNSTPASSSTGNAAPSQGAQKANDAPKTNGHVDGGKDDADAATQTSPLTDARLYATWDHQPKDFRVPLAIGNRTRTGSLHMHGAASAGILRLGGHGVKAKTKTDPTKTGRS